MANIQVRCDNCGKVWDEEQVENSLENGGIDKLLERIEPGGMVPFGECPECGALVYPLQEGGEDNPVPFRKKLFYVMEVCRHTKREGAATETDRQTGEERVKFRYFTNDSMVQGVAQAFIDAKLIMLPHRVLKVEDLPQITYRGGMVVNRVRAWVLFTIGDVESDRTVSGISVSEGLDAGSKAIETAITFAKKKFFEIQFLMGSGNFEEANEESYEAALSLAKSASTEDMLLALRMKARSAMRSVGGVAKVAEMLPKDSAAITTVDPEDWDAGLCEKIIRVVKEGPAKVDVTKEKSALEGMAGKVAGGGLHANSGKGRRRGQVAETPADSNGGN
jgi:hypothetical protein